MVERLNFGGEYYDGYEDEDELDIELDYPEDDQGEYQDPNADFSADFDGGDDAAAEDFQGQHDQVEHQMEHAADDTTQVDFDALLGWRRKARGRRRGTFVPPDMRTYRRPVFVRVADLQNQGNQ